jgi:threonine synthase
MLTNRKQVLAMYLKCVKCGRDYAEGEVLYHCDACGKEGALDVVYDYRSIKDKLTRKSLQGNPDFTMWRYFQALPLQGRTGIQPLQAGWTPLYSIDRVRALLELPQLYLKDDSRNPTGSLKDRASAVGIAKAIELGRKVVCAASTGNAASSLSGFAASAGIRTYIFVPETAPEAKVAQLLIFGSNVFLVKGSYDEAHDLCYEAAQEFDWYNRSCAINPYLVEGKKTIAYEICEQLEWKAPDVVVMAVGDGCSIAGAWKGFYECYKLGLTDSLPRMIGIQAENSNPVSRAYLAGTEEFEYRPPVTLADSISVGIPRNGLKALKAVRESGGAFVDVSDQRILEAMRFLAQNTGVFAEPAGATSMAGIMKLRETGLLSEKEKVVSIVTGSGLKDIRSAVMAAGKARRVDPCLSALKEMIKEGM